MKKQFQSKSVPRGTRTIWRYLGALFLIFTLGIGQMWAETVSLPSTALTLPTIGLSNNWGTSQATHFYYNDATNHYTIYLPYALRVNSSTQTWFAQTTAGSSANATWTALDGTIFKGYSYYEIKDKDNKERYDKIKKNTGGVHNFRVKNCTKVVAYVKLGKKGDEITAKAYEVSAGVVSATASVTGSHTNSSSATAGTISLNNLDYKKEYVITIHQSTGGSDGIFYEIAFYNHAFTVTYDAGEGSGTVPTETDKDPGTKFNLGSASGLSHDGGKSFLGWKDQDDNTYEAGYEYTMPVENVTLTAQWGTPASTYDITFNNGGHGTAPDAINASKVTLAELSAEGYLHKGWVANKAVTVDETPVAAGTLIANGKTAHVSEATEFTAQWATVWTVTYYDGVTSLGTEIVENGNAPAEYAAKQTKTLASFVSWYSDAQLNTPIADITALSITANTPIYGKWDKAYAESIDMEQFVIDNKKSGNWKAYLDAANIAYSADGLSLDSLDSSKGNNNYPYLGLKFNKNKTADLYVTGNLKAGKLMIVKVGNISSTHMDIDGVTQTTPAIVGGTDTEPACTYWYYNADKEFKLVKTNSSTASVLKAIVITDPYEVTYNANGGDPVAPATFTGTALTLPSAVNGTASFLGWFDAATGGNKIGEAGDSYIPTASIELFAHWESISTDARLASITFSSNAGTLSPAFDPEVVNYTYTMPYKTAAIPTITGATSVNANAQTPIIGDAATAWGGSQTIKGVAQSGDKKTYTITMQVAPKDGISLIKVATTGGTNKTVTGVYAGDGDVNLSSSKKMDKGKYIGFTLNGTALQAGDKINVHTTQASSAGNSHIIFYDNMTDKNELYDTEAIGGVGDNIFTINADMVGKTTAYVHRASDNAPTNWNGYVDYIEATRVVMPTLTAIKIDGRNGEIDALDDKHFNVTIPYASVLTSLTVVPTIVRNAAHATTPEAVISNEGAWVIGDNTYRVMDKDGDYTDYTITLARDVLKHTVSFNAHGGTSVASVEVVHNEYLAAAPTAPEKEDYIFQYWSLTDGGAEVDVTSIVIDKDTTFHAVWASDGGIKLIVDGTSGKEVNITNYITGVASSKVTIGTTEYDCVTFEGTVGSSVAASNMKYLDRHVTYNATTTQTKVKLHLYNNSDNKRTIYVQGVIEGNTSTGDIVNLLTLQLNGKEEKTTDYIEFNNAKNRSIYVFVSSDAGDIKILQEKVIESGEPLKKAGDSGYSLNMNKGRVFGAKDATLSFEGMTYTLNGDYAPVSSTVLKVKSNNIVFVAAAPTLMKVTTANDKTYYVTKDVAGTDNETAKTGVSEFDLTAGTWYITAGGSEVQFTNIAFEAPKCEKPTVADMDDVDLCEGAAFTALAVSASVSDEGTLHYAWFKEAGETDEAVGTDQATYTPAADGQYYVIVTNHKDNFTDNSKTSNTITVEHFAAAVITTAPVDVMKEAGQSATLSVVASGKNCTYEWFACDDALGTNPVAFIPAETGTSLTITVAGEKYYKVEVSSDCGAPVSAVAKVKEWTAYPQADVTGSITWDWTNAAWPAEGTASFKVVDGELDLLANQNSIVPVVDGVNGFRADMLLGSGQYVWRSGGADKKCFQGTELKFHTTVAGTVTLWYRSTSSGKDVKVYINGNDAGHHSTGNYTKSSTIVVPANSDVRITKEGETYVRINKIVFNANPDYTRPVSNNIGTLCVDHNVLAGGALGATFYQIASRNEIYNDKIDFEEVLPNEELKAGEPYIFHSNTGKIELFYGATEADAPVAVRGMIGSFVDAQVDITEVNKSDILYIAQNKLWNCEDLVDDDLEVVANRAYIVMSDVPTYAEAHSNSNGAPRRRVTLGKDAEQVVTGVENLNASEQPVKLLINGQIFILRGEKMFDATGRLVK